MKGEALDQKIAEILLPMLTETNLKATADANLPESSEGSVDWLQEQIQNAVWFAEKSAKAKAGGANVPADWETLWR